MAGTCVWNECKPYYVGLYSLTGTFLARREHAFAHLITIPAL